MSECTDPNDVVFRLQFLSDPLGKDAIAEINRLRDGASDRSRISMLEKLCDIAGTDNEIIEAAADEIMRLRAQLAQAIADRDVLAKLVRAWQENAEDTHDQNYGYCRPGCSKCAGEKAAWELSRSTDASGALGRAGG